MSRLNSEYSVCSAPIGCTLDGTSNGVGRRLRQAEMAHLAGRDELGHRPDGLLDGNLGIRSVQVVQVDVVDVEALQ